MGDLYRARDLRLRRDVAIKVIRDSLVTPEFVIRLNREARATSALNHPNIVAVFDIGTAGDVPYIVTELLEGESLRRRMDRGVIPMHKAVSHGIQIARGLAAAHAKGICHRDVKPGNIFLTTDGRVKVLDFGLARVTKPDATAGIDDSTASAPSEAGGMRGTVGYMSPEQVLGETVDPRTDIFALGTVLYEMLSGRRAFDRPSPIEIHSAVLRDEPRDLREVNSQLPPALAVAVHRCLEKNKEERFQSAEDLAFHLEQIEHGGVARPLPASLRSARRRAAALVVGLIAAAVVGAALARLIPPPRVPLTFHQLTFHRGRIGGARFSAGGIAYSLAMGSRLPRVWKTPVDSPESIRTEYAATDVLSARNGKLALSTQRRFAHGLRFVGTLAESSDAAIETPQPVLEDVEDADWDPEGAAFAVVRGTGGSGSRLEYPVGETVYKASGSILSPRVSRDGGRVAFWEDPAGVGDKGRLVLVDRGGHAKTLTRDWSSARGLAWSPRGDEIWFTAAEGRANRSLLAIDLEGHERLVLSSPGSLTIWDVSPDGRVLLTRDDERRVLMGGLPNEPLERDLSWFDTAGLAAVSADGAKVLFGDRFGVYLRETSGAPPQKLQSKEAYPDDLSPDGEYVLAVNPSANQLSILSTKTNNSRVLHTPGITSFSGSRWFPGGRRILFNGREAEHRLRSYVFDVDADRFTPLTPEGTWALSISPDGAYAAAMDANGISLWPTEGGSPRAVPGAQRGDRPIGFSADGRLLFTFRRDEIPTEIYRLEVATGKRHLWRTISPLDPDGVYAIDELQIAPKTEAYFYSYRRVLSELYVVDGLR